LRYTTFLTPFWHVVFMSAVAAIDFSAALALYLYGHRRKRALFASPIRTRCVGQNDALPWLLTAAFVFNYASFALFFATLKPDWPSDSESNAEQNV
jgi:hypothetical protein